MFCVCAHAHTHLQMRMHAKCGGGETDSRQTSRHSGLSTYLPSSWPRFLCFPGLRSLSLSQLSFLPPPPPLPSLSASLLFVFFLPLSDLPSAVSHAHTCTNSCKLFFSHKHTHSFYMCSVSPTLLSVLSLPRVLCLLLYFLRLALNLARALSLALASDLALEFPLSPPLSLLQACTMTHACFARPQPPLATSIFLVSRMLFKQAHESTGRIFKGLDEWLVWQVLHDWHRLVLLHNPCAGKSTLDSHILTCSHTNVHIHTQFITTTHPLLLSLSLSLFSLSHTHIMSHTHIPRL